MLIDMRKPKSKSHDMSVIGHIQDDGQEQTSKGEVTSFETTAPVQNLKESKDSFDKCKETLKEHDKHCGCGLR